MVLKSMKPYRMLHLLHPLHLSGQASGGKHERIKAPYEMMLREKQPKDDLSTDECGLVDFIVHLKAVMLLRLKRYGQTRETPGIHQ